jgi:hypothetical protein
LCCNPGSIWPRSHSCTTWINRQHHQLVVRGMRYAHQHKVLCFGFQGWFCLL